MSNHSDPPKAKGTPPHLKQARCVECGGPVANGEFVCLDCQARKSSARTSDPPHSPPPAEGVTVGASGSSKRSLTLVGCFVIAIIGLLAFNSWRHAQAVRGLTEDQNRSQGTRTYDYQTDAIPVSGNSRSSVEVSTQPTLQGDFVSVDRVESGLGSTQRTLRFSKDGTFEHVAQGRGRSFSGNYTWDGSIQFGKILLYSSIFPKPIEAQYQPDGIQLITADSYPIYIPQGQVSQLFAQDAKDREAAAQRQTGQQEGSDLDSTLASVVRQWCDGQSQRTGRLYKPISHSISRTGSGTLAHVRIDVQGGNELGGTAILDPSGWTWMMQPYDEAINAISH